MDNQKMRDILTRIITALNDKYINTEFYMGMPPMKRGKYNGKREGLKIAIGEVEKEMEKLIKDA